MDAITGGVGDVVANALEVQGQNGRMAVEVALLKKSFETERLMATEIARMLQVGTALDVSA